MKALRRILFVFLASLIVMVVSAYYVITLPAFQKKLIEDLLPEGSSIRAVQITKESIQLTDLSVFLPNGMIIRVDKFYSKFPIFSALFDRTIFLSETKLDGLNIKLVDSKSLPQPSLRSSESKIKNLSLVYLILSRTMQYAGETDWRFDIDPVEIRGEIIDGSTNSYTFGLTTTPVGLGVESTVLAKLGLDSKQSNLGKLKNIDSVIKLNFAQKENGGFEQIRLESLIEGTGASGDILLSIAQDLDLSFKKQEEIININLGFEAGIAHPEIFVPELIGVDSLSLKGVVKASFGGDTLTLNAADIDTVIDHVPVATVKLNKSLNWGTEQSFFGELMKIDLINFPLNLIGPWLGDDVQVSGEPISAEIVIAGEQSGEIKISAIKPIQAGPFSMEKDMQILFDEVIIRMNPTFELNTEGVFWYDLGEFQLLDRYGEIIHGRASGSKKFALANSLLTGWKADMQFNIGLSALFQQPILERRTSIMDGQAKLIFTIDSEDKYPTKVQTYITGLRARNSPSLRKKYSFFSKLNKTENDGYMVYSEFLAGSKENPSSDVQITAQAMPSNKANPFKFTLSAPKVSQSDIDFLSSALKPQEGFLRDNSSGQNTKTLKQKSKIPIWAKLHGEAIIKLDEFILASGNTINGISALATISDPSSSIKQIDASIKSSALSGKAKVSYNFQNTSTYQISSTLTFNNIDPSIFSRKRAESFPVKGFFDGSLNLTGKGVDFKASLENAHGDFIITGRDGYLTAFELDERSQLGLLGASILGQSLNRPGISAMSRAIPYFKDMHFDRFILKLIKPEDKTIHISQLLIQGDNLMINGKGSIATTNLNGLIKKPLILTLEFGARGRLIDHLETLGLLTPMIDENGFRTLNKSIKIGGTLSNPDTSALKQVLNHAASRALEQPSIRELIPKSDEIPSQYRQDSIKLFKDMKDRGKSKEEKILDDIETGLNLLDSIFG